MNPPRYLLDTHTLIWALVDDSKLSRDAARIVLGTPQDRLAISDLTLQEIGLLLNAGKLQLPDRFLSQLEAALEHIQVLPVTLPIALHAPALRLPHGDQFDRIICATARAWNIPLVTRDANITDAGVCNVVW